MNNYGHLKSKIGECRVLGIDYGDKRIGTAISDIGWIIASPLKVLDNHGAYKKLFQIISEYEIGVIVVGMPISLNGENIGMQATKVKKFISKLEELLVENQRSIDLVVWDERLSSKAAHRVLLECDTSSSYKRNNIDKIAASFILQGFIDRIRYYGASF
ncbi:MAG: Holliday junction resolvase RuvX [Holosporales bacterium]|jgi:putative Holliday junction resolvase|nr:Holliday junction resolvase RuvX [Holosporales bacterium]